MAALLRLARRLRAGRRANQLAILSRPGALCRGSLSRSRGVSQLCGRPKPNASSAQASTERQLNSTSHGRKIASTSAAIAAAPPGCAMPLKLEASARPQRLIFTCVSNEPASAPSSVLLASSTAMKPSQRRIVPAPRAPPGSASLTMRQRSGRNQTTDAPNQPRTTMCMPEIESMLCQTDETAARPRRCRLRAGLFDGAV